MRGVPPDVPRRGTGDPGRKVQYICTGCGRDVKTRDNLIAKRVSFRGVGHGKSDIKSRVIAWLCIIPNGPEPSCRDKDPDWNREKWVSPGMEGTRRDPT